MAATITTKVSFICILCLYIIDALYGCYAINGVTATLEVIPMWDNNETDCSLTIDTATGDADTVVFHGSSLTTCTAETILTTTESALLISQIRNDNVSDIGFMYAEVIRDMTLPYCYNRYIAIKGGFHSCSTTISNRNLLLSLQGNTSVSLKPVFSNETSIECLEDKEDKLVHPIVNSTTNCLVKEYNRSIRCEPIANSYNQHGNDGHTDTTMCGLTFPMGCNAVIGNREASLNCLTHDNYYFMAKAILIYPSTFTGLELIGKNIYNVTIGAFQGMKTVSTLNLAYNELTVLISGVLKGLSNLKILNLKSNQLFRLEDHAFDDNLQLNILSLSLNRLTSIPAGLFDKLRNLNELYLYGNLLVRLNYVYFSGLHNLAALHLHYNGLLSLDLGIFRYLRNLNNLYLHDNELDILKSGLFRDVKDLADLDLAYNKLTTLNNDVFADLHVLKNLRLKGNRITTFDSNIFGHFYTMQFLSLSTNELISLPEGLLNTLTTLVEIYLQENQLITIVSNTFYGLYNVTTLSVSKNRLTNLDGDMFKDLFNLLFLDLSENSLTSVPNIKHIPDLMFLNLKSNILTWVTGETFVNLPNYAELLVSQHEICNCYFADGLKCSAANARSPYLTCDRLLTNRNFLVMTWLIGLNALFGNLFVLAWRQIRHQKSKGQSLWLGNLAISDFLMGLYMIIIACADIWFGTHFPMQAEQWRSGIICRTAGALSILSSEASVFFITFISIDRFISIKYPHSTKRFGLRSKKLIVIFTWLFSLALGVIPSVLAGNNYKFYDNSHVCIGLPLTQIGIYTTEQVDDWFCKATGYCYYYTTYKSQYAGSEPGMFFSTALFLGLNCISYLIILGCYIEIIRVVYLSSKRAGLNKEMKEQIRLTAKVAAIVLTDFLCWFPVILLGILVQTGVLTLPPSVYAWFVTFILPINSAINPYLYTIAAIVSNIKKQKESRVTSRQGTCTNKPKQTYNRSQETQLQTISTANQSRVDYDQNAPDVLPNVPMAESTV